MSAILDIKVLISGVEHEFTLNILDLPRMDHNVLVYEKQTKEETAKMKKKKLIGQGNVIFTDGEIFTNT